MYCLHWRRKTYLFALHHLHTSINVSTTAVRVYLPIIWRGFISRSAGFTDILAVNLGISRKDGEVNEYWNKYIKEARCAGLKLLSWNVWDQGFSGSVGKLTAMFPISHEWILVFGKERKRLNLTVENKRGGTVNDYVSDRQANGSVSQNKSVVIRDKREMGTVVRLPPLMSRGDTSHPAAFPVMLPAAYIESITSADDVVLDPFMGSGTTGIACVQTGRRFIGIEIDPEYYAIAERRIRAEIFPAAAPVVPDFNPFAAVPGVVQ